MIVTVVGSVGFPSLSLRRAWIEIDGRLPSHPTHMVALLTESVD